MKKALFFIVLSALVSCTDEEFYKKGKQQLETMGYSNVRKSDNSFFCCSDDDWQTESFKAEDKNGNIITGCFCGGYGKGLTIRFE